MPSTLTKPKPPLNDASNQELDGVCSLCGHRGIFAYTANRSVRSDYACTNCRADLRHRDLGAVVLDEFSRGKHTSLYRAAKDHAFDALSIYEPSLRGPFTKYFRDVAGYEQSYFWENVAPGDMHNGVVCQDLRQLTYDDDSFDLVLTSDIFEHVFEPERAFEEIYRVLRPQGMHIFSIPYKWPVEPKSVARAVMKNGRIQHHQSEVYHTAGDGSRCLVVTDWGTDLLDILDGIGFRTSVVRRSGPLFPMHTNATFVSRKS
jgi:SAM-dependent methyltransferase